MPGAGRNPNRGRRFAALLLMATCAAAQGQELEPRAYSASPIGTNFAVIGYSHLKGDVLTDPSLPIKNVQASIDLYITGYARTFEFAGRSASLGFVVPYAKANVSGDVFDAPREVYRAGLGDVRLRFAVSLVGNPPLTPQEFAKREPSPVLGASVSVIVPTGQYVPSHLVNVGSNRWAFKPEVGFSYPRGKWFFEGSAGAWFYEDNREFLATKRRGQDPLYVAQAHAGYNFAPGFWLAVNGAYTTGGRTKVDGVENEDVQHNSRYGITLAVPVTKGWACKVAWSKGFTVRAGGDYDMVSVALQYRWFDK